MAATETFADVPQTTVTAGGNTAPVAGTVETWTVTSSATFPAASTGVTQFHVADPAFPSEIIAVTNVSGTTWTVTRGAGTNALTFAHSNPFTVKQAVPAAWLTSVTVGGLANPMTTLGDVIYENGTPAATRLAGSTSARRKVLTQTGTGSVSAAPAWQEPATAWINVVDQGVDPTGVAAADTALASAFTALGSNSAVFYFPAGTYKLTSGWTLALGTQQVVIWCDPSVKFVYSGSGDAIRMYCTVVGSPASARGSGIIGEPLIDGTSAGGGAAGLHIGDISQAQVFVKVVGFNASAASIGVHFDNTVSYTEQMTGRISHENCSNGVVFDVSGANTSTSSYARPHLDILCSTTGGVTRNGIVIQNGAAPYDGAISYRGNFPSGSGTPGAVLTVTGTVPVGHPGGGTSFSKIYSCDLDIGVETTTAGPNYPQTINFGAAGNQIRDTKGVLAFEDFNGATGIFGPSNQGSVGALFRHKGTIIGQTTGLAAIDNANNYTWAPSDNGLLVANLDWASAGATSILTAGTLYLMKVPIREVFTWTNVWFGITTAGVGAGTQSFVGLYNAAGTLLSGSADMSASLTSTGPKSIALTTPQVFSTSASPSTNAFVWVAILVNLATTQPTLRGGSGIAVANVNLVAATLRFATNGTGLTALPGSITPASNVSAAALTLAVAGN